MKKTFFTLACLALTLCLSFAVFASPDLLLDFEGLLTDDEATEIEETLLSMSEEHGIDFVIVTSHDFDGKSSEDFADDFFDYGGYKPNGIILAISDNCGEVFITTAGSGMKYFPDDDIDDIFDEIMPYLSDGEYAKSFSVFLSECEKLCTNYENPPKAPFLSAKQIVICVVIGIIIGFIGVSTMKSSMKSVKFKPNAKDYMVVGSLKLTEKYDIFLFRNVTRVRRQTNSGGNRTGSSGRSHGGSGRSF